MNRLILPKLAVLLILVVLVGRLYHLQVITDQAERFRYGMEVSTTRYLRVRPMRGEIFASDGKTILAQTVPIYNVSIRPADLPPPNTYERAALFAQLGQVLGISSTLTISPAMAIEQDAILRSDLHQGLGEQVIASAQHHQIIEPLRLAVPPGSSTAIADLLDQYSPLVRFELQQTAALSDQTPPEVLQLSEVALAELSSLLAVTGTLIISPATELVNNPNLHQAVVGVLGQKALERLGPPKETSWLTLTIPPEQTMTALILSEAYSMTLQLFNPIADSVRRSNIPNYTTVEIKKDVSRDIALILRENATTLPGVVVEQDYRRTYPLSAQIQSLSHLLGYIGRIDQCELVLQNPARTWVIGLFDSIGHAAQCGVLQKQLNPYQLGIRRYLNEDRIGKDGVEASYEEQLRGQLGLLDVLVDARGSPVRSPRTILPARDGNNLVLTIDVDFQRQVEQILRNWIAEGERRRQNQPAKFSYKRSYLPIRSGVAIVMEVQTGRILSMVSWPSYDNNIWDPTRSADLEKLLNPSDEEARKELARLAILTNRAIAGQYPPGSTLKQFVGAIALHDGIIKPDTKVRDPGRLILEDRYVPGRFYHFVNSVARDNGEITVADALKVSSNIFFMSVAGGNKENVVNLKPEEQTLEKGVDIKGLAEGLSWFGFGEPTHIKLAGERAGRVPTPAWKQKELREVWTTGDTYNAAIGQGHLEVTPLQLLTAATAIANGGSLYRPQIAKFITDSRGQIVEEIQPDLIRTIPVEDEYLAVIREGMRRSVTEGVNKAARDECSGLQIAGKTGTAEFGPAIVKPDGSTTRQSHSWFVGFAPYDNPQIQVLVLSEGTGDLDDGSATIAVPAVTQIMQAYFKISSPNPLPKSCQQNLPPLPAQNEAPPIDLAEPFGPWSPQR